jgi:transposase
MAYGIDLRRKVLNFVTNGGSKSAAEERFGVGRRAIYDWVKHGCDQAPRKPGPKGPRKLDLNKLRELAAAHGSSRKQKDIAKALGVSISTVSKGLKKLRAAGKQEDIPNVKTRKGN